MTFDLLNDTGRPPLKKKNKKKMPNVLEERCGRKGALGATRKLQQQHCVGDDLWTPLLTVICPWEDLSS